jgi:hypothetical protein
VKLLDRNSYLIALIVLGCSHRSINHRSFSFDQAKYVEVLAYSDRTYVKPELEDSLIGETIANDSVVQVLHLKFPASSIREKLLLTSPQRDSLFQLLTANICPVSNVGICFSPRHMLVFRNAKFEAYAYIEICFECTNYETSGDFHLNYCYEKSEALKNLLASFGITYFGSGESG